MCCTNNYPWSHPNCSRSATLLSVHPGGDALIVSRPPADTTILIFVFLERKVQEKVFCTECQQAFPAFILLLISSWMEFWFPRDILKYMNLSTHSRDLLLIFMLLFCPACWCTDMTIHLLATKEGETTSFSDSLSQCSLLQRRISSHPWRARLRSVKWTSWSQHRKYRTNQLPPLHGSQKETLEKFIVLNYILKITSLCLTKEISSQLCPKLFLQNTGHVFA